MMTSARAFATVFTIDASHPPFAVTIYPFLPREGAGMIQSAIHGIIFVVHYEKLAVLQVGMALSTNVEVFLQ